MTECNNKLKRNAGVYPIPHPPTECCIVLNVTNEKWKKKKRIAPVYIDIAQKKINTLQNTLVSTEQK